MTPFIESNALKKKGLNIYEYVNNPAKISYYFPVFTLVDKESEFTRRL